MTIKCPICDFPVNMMQTKVYKDKEKDEMFVFCPYGHDFNPKQARETQRVRELCFLGKHLRTGV